MDVLAEDAVGCAWERCEYSLVEESHSLYARQVYT
jgi:hypothetical protein